MGTLASFNDVTTSMVSPFPPSSHNEEMFGCNGSNNSTHHGHISLAAAIIVAQQLDGVAFDAVHLIAEVVMDLR